MWGPTAVLFLTAFIVQKAGESKAQISGGDGLDFGFGTSVAFDSETLFQYNTAASLLVLLAIVCLLATLVFHATQWKSPAP